MKHYQSNKALPILPLSTNNLKKTDVAMVVDDGLKKHVVAFAKDEKLFFRRFTTAYQKLVDSTATTKFRY